MKEKNTPKVLFIGFVWPEVTSTAASQNIYSYLRTFADGGYQVHFASAAQTTPLSTDLSHLQVISHKIVLNSDCFDVFIRNLQPDIVVFDRFLSEEQFAWRVMKELPQALRILDCEDLHFLRHARHKLYKSTGYQPNDALYLEPKAVIAPENRAFLYNEMTSREMASIYRCDLVLVLSDFEKDILVTHFNVDEKQVMHLPYLLEKAAANENASKEELQVSRKDFISIGNFRHAPNIDAVNVLIQHIWPSIHKALPEAKCHIYGSYLPPKIKQLANPKKGLYVHGYIDDHLRAIRDASVLLAPIQFGAGVKGKIVDALQCGLPSITTPIGAEGIAFKRWPGAIATKREEFIQAAIQTYKASADKRREMQSDMAEILDANFNSQLNKLDLLLRVDSALAELDSRRRCNFMQQLVSHHSLQTHQYMSQWISAKNAHKSSVAPPP